MIDRDFGTKRSLLKCDECETVLDYTEPHEVFTEKQEEHFFKTYPAQNRGEHECQKCRKSRKYRYDHDVV